MRPTPFGFTHYVFTILNKFNDQRHPYLLENKKNMSTTHEKFQEDLSLFQDRTSTTKRS